MKNIKQKRIIIPVIIIIFIGAAVSIMPWWSDIDITLNGIQARIGDEEYTEEKTINISGRYWRYLFRADRFEGRIKVEGYDFTYNAQPLVSLNQNSLTLDYMGNVNGKPFIESLGRLNFKPVFSEVLIWVYGQHVDSNSNSRGWTSEDGLFISAPAGSREQAIDIANNLAGYINWE